MTRWKIPLWSLLLLAAAGGSVLLLERPWSNSGLALCRAVGDGLALAAVIDRCKRWPHERKTWGFIAAALALYLLVDLYALIAFIRPNLHGIMPWAMPLLLHFGAIPLFITALFLWPPGTDPNPKRLPPALDGLLFGYAAYFLIWGIGLRLWVGASRSAPEATSLFVRFALLSILLGVCVRHGSRDGRRWLGPLAFLSAYFLLTTVNSAFSASSMLAGQARWPGVVGNLLKPAALMLIVAAAHSPQALNATGDLRDHPRLSAFIGALPYVPALITTAGLMGMSWIHPEGLDVRFIRFGTPLMGLLLLRQFRGLRDLTRLSRNLEAKVVERTRALEAAQNLTLQTERMNTVASLGAGLAHDLNNLIGVSKNYAELMAMDLEEGRLPDPQDLRRIKESSTRAGELTSQLMAFGRQQGLKEVRFDLRTHLLERHSLFRMVARPSIDLILEPGDSELPLRMDRTQVDQLIVNLLSNAQDAMPQGGRIWVRCWKDQGDALLEIRDQGSGMPEAVRARIFEPFFTTKEAGRGTGLGLASVKAVVDQCGGKLEVETLLGKGTTFWIRIPLDTGPA